MGLTCAKLVIIIMIVLMLKKYLHKVSPIRFAIIAGGLIITAPILGGVAFGITTNTTISSVISPVISLFTTNGTVNVNVTPTNAGAQTVASDTVTVSTNDISGYTLKLEDNDANSNLVSGANNITPTAGTQASPIALVSGKWGYRVDGLGGFGAGPTGALSNVAITAGTYAGVPVSGSPNTLKTTATNVANDTTTVWYSVAANTTVLQGTYTDIVTYTALTN